MMRRAMIEGKCGLLALARPMDAEEQHQLNFKDRPRALVNSLGTTMMRRMIGRYKGFRCARMVAGVKGGEQPVQVRPAGAVCREESRRGNGTSLRRGRSARD